MNCPKCYAAVGLHENFCPNCGTPLQENEAESNQPESYGSSTPSFDSEPNYRNSTPHVQPSQSGPYYENNSFDGDPYADQRPSNHISFADAIRKYYKNYFNFDSRATIREYWFVALYRFLVILPIYILNTALTVVTGSTAASAAFGTLLFVFMAANFIPDITIGVRRLHDIGKSGTYLLLSLIPIVGGIVLLVYSCKGSTEDNQWGPAPQD